MTATDTRSLISYPPGMAATEVEEVLGVSEHSRRQLESEGRLVPVTVGRRKLFPRWQLFALLGLVDPDLAAQEVARELIEGDGPGRAEAPPFDGAPDSFASTSATDGKLGGLT